MSERDKNLIEKIINYCEKIEKISKNHNNSFEEYKVNDEMQMSLDMCIFQIGELSTHISNDVKSNNINIPWNEMRGLRNIEAHEYDSKDYETMWNTISKDVPDLKEKLRKITS